MKNSRESLVIFCDLFHRMIGIVQCRIFSREMATFHDDSTAAKGNDGGSTTETAIFCEMDGRSMTARGIFFYHRTNGVYDDGEASGDSHHTDRARLFGDIDDDGHCQAAISIGICAWVSYTAIHTYTANFGLWHLRLHLS